MPPLRKSNSLLPTANPEPLSRTTTNTSIHAHNSIRRMATHETGEYIDPSRDGAGDLDTHDEHENEHEHEHEHGSSSDEHDPEETQDEDARIGLPSDSPGERGEEGD